MLAAVQTVGRKGDSLVTSPEVVQSTMISIITIISTPMMVLSGTVGVTYGAGQKVLLMSTSLSDS